MMLQKRFHMKSRRTNLPRTLYQCAPVAGQVGTIFVRRLRCYIRGLDGTRNCHIPSSDAPTDIVLFHTNGNFQSKKCEKMQSKMTKVYQPYPGLPYDIIVIVIVIVIGSLSIWRNSNSNRLFRYMK